MDVFIVRPFGKKQNIDFDEVEAKLIQPALRSIGISGGTAATILRAGNIRIDMFERLLMADLVIADITIHNANVFYELGIRHSLRDRHTFLIRGGGPTNSGQKLDDVPFDLKTDRYLTYSLDNPVDDIARLADGLRATLEDGLSDSPIYFALPTLQPQEAERFLAVPVDFGEEEEVARAKTTFHHQVGKLSLLASEVDSYRWRMPALRLLGESLYNKKAYERSRQVWEMVRSSRVNQDDVQANERLSTIYQRLADKHVDSMWDELLTKSDQALTRLNKQRAGLTRPQRAEMFSLMARSAKTRWIKLLDNLQGSRRQRKALESSLLQESYEKYQAGYYEDLNHYYAGINALWMLTILLALIQEHPEEWQAKFASERKASQAIDDLQASWKRLSSCLEVSLDAADEQWKVTNEGVPWHLSTRADLVCLTEINPPRVTKLYLNATRKIPAFSVDSIRRQLTITQQLGILSSNVEAVLKELPITSSQQTHYLLFTGHMIDAPDRAVPRFPASAETTARLAIHATIEKVIRPVTNTQFIGIAGGASGGDILFHEVCQQLGVKSELFLVAQRDMYVAESVQPAGNNWTKRFNHLFKTLPCQLLGDSLELPDWLRNRSNYSIWERNNLWMLFSALAEGGQNMTLIALWDKKGGDGNGGTEHMVKQAKTNGGEVLIIDINEL